MRSSRGNALQSDMLVVGGVLAALAFACSPQRDAMAQPASPRAVAEPQRAATVSPKQGAGVTGALPVPPASEVQRTASSLAAKARAQAHATPDDGAEHDAAGELFGFTEADVRAAAGEPKTTERHWRIAAWKARAGSIVALSFRSTDATSGLKPRVALLEVHAAKLTLIASGSLGMRRAECENEPNGASADAHFELDLAAYVIGPSNPAIGVRFSCHHSFPSGEGTETRLSLLELRGHALREVLDERIAWSSDDRVSGRTTEGAGGVLVQATAHGSHFELTLQTTVTSRAIDSGDDERARVAEQPPRIESKRFVWAGNRYAAPDG